MYVLRRHDVMLLFGNNLVRLRTRVCEVCREQRTDHSAKDRYTPLNPCEAQSHSQSQPRSKRSVESSAYSILNTRARIR